MNRLSRRLFLTLLILLAGCSSPSDRALQMLENAETFELYSLEPMGTGDIEGERHYGWLILGKTTVSDADTRRQLSEALKQGMAKKGSGAKSFVPRHAIRATRGNTTTDLLIGFECRWVHIYRDGRLQSEDQVASDIQPVFDDALKAAGLPLAKK